MLIQLIINFSYLLFIEISFLHHQNFLIIPTLILIELFFFFLTENLKFALHDLT